METIFDHAPTAAELTSLFGAPITREDYFALPRDADTESARLYRLFALRGDDEKSLTYLDRIEDKQYRFNVGLADVH